MLVLEAGKRKRIDARHCRSESCRDIWDRKWPAGLAPGAGRAIKPRNSRGGAQGSLIQLGAVKARRVRWADVELERALVKKNGRPRVYIRVVGSSKKKCGDPRSEICADPAGLPGFINIDCRSDKNESEAKKPALIITRGRQKFSHGCSRVQSYKAERIAGVDAGRKRVANFGLR